jgi:hypothetical protein
MVRADSRRSDPGRADLDLERAIEHLLDADGADWSIATGLLASRPQQLEALRVVADVAAGCRRLQDGAASSPPAPLFRWGNLEVHEHVASGASADVYRAYDPALGIDVALKLHRDAPHSPPASRFLAEARHLARVRQRNIVGVYGAAVHDDRAGIWCEWIEGRSLTQTLHDHGAFASAEAAYVGLELCAALGALHAAGILHGDLKPANVLRERGGRIVLVDLGAGGRPHEINTASADYGTPGYLPPEVLAGASRKPEHDLYALGRMIETLLAGSDDARAPPAIPPLLQRVLARATATDPASRYTQAAELQRDLGAALAEIHGVDGSPPQRSRGRWLVALAAAGVLVLGLLAAQHWTASPWSTDLQLLRRTDVGTAPLASGATLAQGDRLVLELSSSRPVHVYVLNEDAGGDMHVLFPLRGLDLTNPLPANGRVRLPGGNGGRELSWEIASSGQREEFLVVLASAPLAQIQRLVDSAAVALDVERGVGRVRAEVPGGVTLRGAHLNALLQELAPYLRDRERARIQAYRFNDPGAAAP